VSRIKPRDAEKGKRFQTPSVVPQKSDDSRTPLFCLHHLQKGYCVLDCEKNEKAALAETLRKLSQLSWSQIRQAPRHGSGYEKISKNSIRAAIPPNVTEDTSIIAFRFCGKAPMVGYRLREVFHICWLDRKYTLYPHG